MNRRSFLKTLARAAAASTTAYFLSPVGGWKSDVIAHPEEKWPSDLALQQALARLNAYWEGVRAEANQIWSDPRNLEIAAEHMGLANMHTFDGLHPLHGYLHVKGGRNEYVGLA